MSKNFKYANCKKKFKKIGVFLLHKDIKKKKNFKEIYFCDENLKKNYLYMVIYMNMHYNEMYFRAFGLLKSVRLPQKLVGVEKHRGFGFVEYHTQSDAKVPI